jgi:hypothetical protein
MTRTAWLGVLAITALLSACVSEDQQPASEPDPSAANPASAAPPPPSDPRAVNSTATTPPKGAEIPSTPPTLPADPGQPTKEMPPGPVNP